MLLAMTSQNGCRGTRSDTAHRKRSPTHGRASPETAGLLALLLLPLAGLCGGCSRGTAAESCEALGMCETPVQPPQIVDVVCHTARGSTCDRQAFEATLTASFDRISSSPGSRLRVWTVGSSVENTVVVAEHVVPPAVQRGSARTREAQARRVTDNAKANILALVGSLLERTPARRSPIAESIAKIALSEGYGLARSIVLVSDGREFSTVADLQCGRLPSDAQFAAQLKRVGVLQPGALDGVEIDFTHFAGTPILDRGCGVSVARDLRLRALWSAALRTAGASRVRITTGPPASTSDNSNPTKESNR